MLLSVVVPTIAGREESLARTLASYDQTLAGTSYELVIIQDAPTWPSACNMGAEKARGEILHFTADDLEALEGWHEQAVAHCRAHNELPAPVVLNHSPDGAWDNHMDGADGQLTHFTRIPLMSRRQWELIGPWPEVQYVADVWVSERGRTLGILTRMIHSYRFVHHWAQEGRDDSRETMEAAAAVLHRMRDEGFPRCG